MASCGHQHDVGGGGSDQWDSLVSHRGVNLSLFKLTEGLGGPGGPPVIDPRGVIRGAIRANLTLSLAATSADGGGSLELGFWSRFCTGQLSNYSP